MSWIKKEFSVGGELRVETEITSRRINNNDKKSGEKDNHERL